MYHSTTWRAAQNSNKTSFGHGKTARKIPRYVAFAHQLTCSLTAETFARFNLSLLYTFLWFGCTLGAEPSLCFYSKVFAHFPLSCSKDSGVHFLLIGIGSEPSDWEILVSLNLS